MHIIRRFLIPIKLLLLILLSHCNQDDAVEVELPQLSEITVSEIEFFSAKAIGDVLNEGNGIVSERGFVWSTSENPTIELETKQTEGSGSGSFSTLMETLEHKTQYFIRAYAINEAGVSYSEEKAFTTLNNNTFFEELELDENLSLFTSELKKYPDLLSLLDDENSSFTVFAPTNDALNEVLSILGINSLSDLREEIAKGILVYHMVSDVFTSSNLTEGFVAKTLQGEDIEMGNGPVIISGATSQASFMEFDRNVKNGTIHIIESIIVPPTIGELIVSTLGTLAEPIVLGRDFSILYQGMKKADENLGEESILSILVGTSNVTFFAPTNATFEFEGITADTFTSAQWNAIIRNHILIGQGGDENNGSISEEDLIDGSIFTTILGGTLAFIHGTPNNGAGIFIDSDNDYDVSNPASTLDGEVAFFDSFVKSNGRIHEIAGILVPE